MKENLLTFNFANLITVGLIVACWYMVGVVGVKAYNRGGTSAN